MGFTRYARKLTEIEELSAEDLFEKLSEYLLQSGFGGDFDSGDFTLDELRDAILRALMSQEVIPLEELERLLDGADEVRDQRLSELIEQLMQRLFDEGFLSLGEVGEPGSGNAGEAGAARFQVTDKGLDFLGYKALQETLGRSSRGQFGRHDTDQLSTGVDATDAPKPYEFGDALNLDATATLLEAVKRRGSGVPIDIEEADLRVRQSELRVSAATVLMLDCSHSMILYGEDRFTPAKRVALALAHLVRNQYPGDELGLVLFHDSAEEVPLRRLPQVGVGPWHTNTAAGLKLARRMLARSRREMKSIVMITDGKPSALTLPDGRIYKNSNGLDPVILKSTFEEVAACRRSGIRIHTFMLARDRALIAFVKKVSEICRGKAYFTTPMTLGRYVTMDFLNRKVETIH